MLELYIFNKAKQDGLTYWTSESDKTKFDFVINFSSDKFKFDKKFKTNELNSFVQNLNNCIKKNNKLKELFSNSPSIDIKIQVIDNYHHQLLIDTDTQTLYLDSELFKEQNFEQTKINLLFALHYYQQRFKAAIEDDIYKTLPDFIFSFELEDIEALIGFYKNKKHYDAGGHYCDYLLKLISDYQTLETSADHFYTLTQLLRNRALVGRQPFNLYSIEKVATKFENDLFAAEAMQAFFDIFSNSFDKEFAKKYYKNLVNSLKHIGFDVVCQRGSRVAHEQGPLLINSRQIQFNEEFEVISRKFNSNFSALVDKILASTKAFIEPEIIFNDCQKLKLFSSELLSLCRLENTASNKFQKVLNNLESTFIKLLNTLRNSVYDSKQELADIILTLNSIQNFEKTFFELKLSFAESLEQLFKQRKKAVIYIQRPSARSGHFIARIALGHKLYIETDHESEFNRLAAIPFSFVCPDFDFVADTGVCGFFENASISIVTNRDSGKPDIKWENAEDLAFTIAPSLFSAIKYSNKYENKNFLYQLETTLIGPLIQLFITLLEDEMSYISSYEKASEGLPELKDKFNELKAGYQDKLIEAAEYIFEIYLLEDKLQEYIHSEKLERKQAILEMTLSLYDVQLDVAALFLLKKEQPNKYIEFIHSAQNILADNTLSYKVKLQSVSKKLQEQFDRVILKRVIKKYLKYINSTVCREIIQNQKLDKVVVTSDKLINNADFIYDLSVAPSRVDFGPHVVASLTTLMGRMLGANDIEAMNQAKEYIDLVSLSNNHLFGTAYSAGSAKVIENTCRAIQYSKAISFQGVFQAFNLDGETIRQTVNSRNTKAAGVHIMEHGTMASTGYCITKEPLFILLSLASDSEDIFKKLGIESQEVIAKLKTLFSEIYEQKKSFQSHIDWQFYCYGKLCDNEYIQKYLANEDYQWLPNLYSMAVLLDHYGLDEKDEDLEAKKLYSSLASKLIEQARVINETGIFQRVHLMNKCIQNANAARSTLKCYADLKIAFNASYKGNVSDERENANQYLIALLLKQNQYLKNSSLPEVQKLIDIQNKNYSLPKEITVYDPLVDPDIFMGGELKDRAEKCLEKISLIEFSEALHREQVIAAVITYGSKIQDWQLFKNRLTELEESKQENILDMLEKLEPDLKLMELYFKGFYDDPKKAYQSCDIIHLNSDHHELKDFSDNLVELKNIMEINNPDSLLVLIDNPQQAKKPFFDYEKSREWLGLGGHIASHMIADEVYGQWKKEIAQEYNWAADFINYLLAKENNSENLTELEKQMSDYFSMLQSYADIRKDFLLQKLLEAEEFQITTKFIQRYHENIDCFNRVIHYQSINELAFDDWLILGGRWLLNAKKSEEIQFVISIFERNKKLNPKSISRMNLFIQEYKLPDIEAKTRIIENSGSTKEADLLVSNAADNIEYRTQFKSQTELYSQRINAYNSFELNNEEVLGSDKNASQKQEIIHRYWQDTIANYITLLKSKAETKILNQHFGKLLKILKLQAEYFDKLDNDIASHCDDFIYIKEFDNLSLVPILGDHRKHGGFMQSLARDISSSDTAEYDLKYHARLGEYFLSCYLIGLTINTKDENEIINQLALFFDQYLNIHEEDYPPYLFHSLCSGAYYGFNQDYFYSDELRKKMFRYAYATGTYIYDILHHQLKNISVLKHSSTEYVDQIIGDHRNGMIPICYQHETICIEERFWDCMRALRNFVRNYHDRHPLPVVIRGKDAKASKIFKFNTEEHVKACYIAAISNPGKHSWDLNCVLRSPLLRQRVHFEQSTGLHYINISLFTPYLTASGEIKQFYTAFEKELIDTIEILAPYKDGSYQTNAEGFVHAIGVLEAEELFAGSDELYLPKPDITMAAHTHSQYISGFIRDLAVPEVWSLISMQQMYSKTVLAEILAEADIEPIYQINFYQNEFKDLASVKEAVFNRTEKAKHIEYWILKASKDSGGRGISDKLSINKDFEAIAEFIFQKTQSDDLVMQEFIPNNARAFVSQDLIEKIEQSFVESGISLPSTYPADELFFAMRSFQSTGGIKGYLFSVNVGSVTVNAGQGAKLFYGEPFKIMPIYLAGKIQNLLEDYGENLLKNAIPQHAKKFALAKKLEIKENKIGSSNLVMLNGLFDYIPYFYALRKDKNGENKRFKIYSQNNSIGGIDFYYSYYGKKEELVAGLNRQESVFAMEQVLKEPKNSVDVDLAIVELNSGLGQANLLQKAIEDMVPENRDMFLEWTEDLGRVGILNQVIKNTV